jgi:hypothetical protein
MGRQVSVAAGYSSLPNGNFIPEIWSYLNSSPI